ncbi:MAG: gamma-glutamylcyclotransferase [bacterium]|nr:gamma-glutamylcyclotransferase [bacterium]
MSSKNIHLIFFVLFIFLSAIYNIYSGEKLSDNSMQLKKSGKILYFAYGSNMLLNRLKNRVPSAISLGTALLKDYTLTCSKLSKDGSNKLSIDKGSAKDEVYGVLYELDVNEKKLLDKAEGLKHGYEETNIDVLFKGKHVTAMTYYGTITNRNILPYKWYKAFVLAGAKFHKFPAKYVKMILHAVAKNDMNPIRNEFNKNILNRN